MKRIITILTLIGSFDSGAQTTFAMLNAGGSTNSASYHWKQISGPASILRTPDEVSCRIDSLRAGTFQYELTCINNFGIDKDSVTITVLPSNYSVTILTATYKNTALTWTVGPEKNVSNYYIQKTKQGSSTTTKVTNYTAKGLSKYTYYLSRTIYKYKYQITPIFKNSTKGKTIYFQ